MMPGTCVEACHEPLQCGAGSEAVFAYGRSQALCGGRAKALCRMQARMWKSCLPNVSSVLRLRLRHVADSTQGCAAGQVPLLSSSGAG